MTSHAIAQQKHPDDVNALQRKAITHQGSHLLIIAGPGTGKTHTLTHRIARFVDQLPGSSKILAITFTNKAAGEMRQRLESRMDDHSHYVLAGTFHSFCLTILRQYYSKLGLPPDFEIASEREALIVLKESFPDRAAKEYRILREKISRSKTVTFCQHQEEYDAYNRLLRQYKLVDFDDIILLVYDLLSTQTDVHETVVSQFPFIFVDEFQDINPIQQALLKLLVAKGNLITAIGDPHQAIYGFRGAEVRYFLEFQKDFSGAKIMSLADNYRCAKNILSASEQVISKIRDRGVPSLTARLYQEGNLIIHQAATDRAEAEYVVHNIEKMIGGVSMFSQDSRRVDYEDIAQRSFGDFAVVYRLNSQRLTLIEAFERSGIPYQVSGDKPLTERPGVMEMLTLCRLAWGMDVSSVLGCRFLEAAVDGFDPAVSLRLKEFWGGKDISFEDIAHLAEQEGLVDDST